MDDRRLLFPRATARAQMMREKARNSGRWSGKKVAQYLRICANMRFLETMNDDELRRHNSNERGIFEKDPVYSSARSIMREKIVKRFAREEDYLICLKRLGLTGAEDRTGVEGLAATEKGKTAEFAELAPTPAPKEKPPVLKKKRKTPEAKALEARTPMEVCKPKSTAPRAVKKSQPLLEPPLKLAAEDSTLKRALDLLGKNKDEYLEKCLRSLDFWKTRLSALCMIRDHWAGKTQAGNSDMEKLGVARINDEYADIKRGHFSERVMRAEIGPQIERHEKGLRLTREALGLAVARRN